MGYKTSEDICGLVQQPQEMCPVIDDIISDIDYAVGELSEIEEAEAAADSLSWSEQKLERLRKEIEALRRWGQDWKDLCIINMSGHEPDLYHRIAETRDKREDNDA